MHTSDLVLHTLAMQPLASILSTCPCVCMNTPYMSVALTVCVATLLPSLGTRIRVKGQGSGLGSRVRVRVNDS